MSHGGTLKLMLSKRIIIISSVIGCLVVAGLLWRFFTSEQQYTKDGFLKTDIQMLETAKSQEKDGPYEIEIFVSDSTTKIGLANAKVTVIEPYAVSQKGDFSPKIPKIMEASTNERGLVFITVPNLGWKVYKVNPVSGYEDYSFVSTTSNPEAVKETILDKIKSVTVNLSPKK